MNLRHVGPVLLAFALPGGEVEIAKQNLPDQPVPVESLKPEARTRWESPFTVRFANQAVTDDIPAFSAVSGTNRNHLNQLSEHSGFEPLAFRTKLRAVADDPDRVLLPPGEAWMTAEGFYDGARVRVYHPIDGKLTLIRDAVLPAGGHKASTWTPLHHANIVTGASSSQFSVVLDDRFLVGATVQVAVTAVAKDGTDSAPSNAVPVLVAKGAGKGAKDDPMGKGPSGGTGTPPAAPTGLAVSVHDGVAKLSWQPVQGAAIAGYRILVAPVAPDRLRGHSLDLPHRKPRPDQIIQEGDLVFVDHEHRRLTQALRSPFLKWPALALKTPFGGKDPYWSDGADVQWELSPHPEPVPAAFVERGRTCLRWTNTTAGTSGFRLGTWGEATNGWYGHLGAGTYRVSAWIRSEGAIQARVLGGGVFADASALPPDQERAGGKDAKPIPPIVLPADGTWKQVEATFTITKPIDKGLGSLNLCFTGVGTCWIDRLVIHRAELSPEGYPPQTVAALRDSHLRFLRTHELIKTKWGYTLDGMTNVVGSNSYAGTRALDNTFHGLLTWIKAAGDGLSPWIQVEMCLSEEEWLGFAEWLCAPYDPANDSPATKPWAAKRAALGQAKPWIDEFPRFAFEVSNETWNQSFAPFDMDWGATIRDGATGMEYSYGAKYGLLNEYIINQLRKSPYWTKAVEAKMTYPLCGWSAAQAFGAEAKRYSPSAANITIANYNNHVGLGDVGSFSDFKRFYLMQWQANGARPQTNALVNTVAWLRGQGIEVDPGVYEYGPNYSVMPGDSKEWKEADGRLSRGLGSAVYCLDTALSRGEAGFVDQAFFTFGHQTGAWGTHTTLANGGHPYPMTKALTLFNRHGTGRFLGKEVTAVPKWDFPAYEAEDNMHKVKRAALPQEPVMSAYATAADDRVTVFLISRRIDGFPVTGHDGFTPTTIALPFTKARKATLYALTGDPRSDDRFKEEHTVLAKEIPVPAGSLRVDAATGTDARGLPPSSIFCYVFEGTDIGPVNRPPSPRIVAEDGVAGTPIALTSASHDPDGDRLTLRWSSGGKELGTGERLSHAFAPGIHTVFLEATDSAGATARIRRDVAVGVEVGGRLWRFLRRSAAADGHQALRVEAADGGLRVTSDGTGGGVGFLAAPPLSGDGTLSATVVSISAKEGLGGLALATPRRGGLGFNLDESLAHRAAIQVLVAADGRVLTLGAQGKPTEVGTTTLPAQVRIRVVGGEAVAEYQAAGAWKEAARQRVAGMRLLPALVADSGKFNKATATVTFTELR